MLRCQIPHQNQHHRTFPLRPRHPALRPILYCPRLEAPDQVMSEGTRSSSDAAVRLSMKHSSDKSNSESETKRLLSGHSMRDVFMLLDDSDVSQSRG